MLIISGDIKKEIFDQAFHTMGPLALSMAGMLVIAPVIADILGPVMTPAFRLIGADPAVFAGMFMGTDVGAVNASMLLPMIIAKLSSGIVAMAVALWMSKGK